MRQITYEAGHIIVEARPDEYALLPALLPDPLFIEGTLCSVALGHIWIWSGDNRVVDRPPDDHMRCDCGAFSWGELESERW